MVYLLAVLVLCGHLSICIFAINRLHATSLPYWVMKGIDGVWYLTLFGVPLYVVTYLILGPPPFLAEYPLLHIVMWGYATICWFAVAMTIPVWLRFLADAHTTDRLVSNSSTRIDTVKLLGHRPVRSPLTDLTSRLPTNQVLQLAVEEKVVRLPRLGADLDGLTIAHISDLHFTGRITSDYFQIVIDRANDLDADLVAISGDIIDHRECRPWLDDVLGRLKSRHGVFYVLGNHDLRVHDEAGVRGQLAKHGFNDLGGRWQLIEINQSPIVLAGNELPWFVPAADMKNCPARCDAKRPLRIAISHSPDQIRWAQVYDFDLMLAGHTHGGQIRLPYVGPIFAPSRYGLKFSAGTFYEDPTLMHVSRGVSGTRPLRFNCAPEITKLVLRAENRRR